MIDDANRGHHWTNAVLGLKAKEIHLCGSEAALKIIVEILKHTGDELTIHKYARFSPLTTEKTPIESLDEIEEGDCFISFSKTKIHELKDKINAHQNKGTDSKKNHCAVLYGALPAESKMMQATYFNERRDDIKYLIASNSIGLGINLNINRIVFTTLNKLSTTRRDGNSRFRNLVTAETE